MNTSIEIFKKRAFEVFEAKDINEVLLVMYRELSFAIRDKSDTVILSRSTLTHLLNGKTIGELPLVYGGTSIYDMARESILKILNRDNLVQQYFHIAHFNEDTVTIMINAKDEIVRSPKV